MESITSHHQPAEQQAATDASGATERTDYQYTISARPEFAFLNLTLAANQTIKVEASAMAAMDTHISMKTKLKGGFSRFLSGESLFINEFTAAQTSGKLQLAAASPGDLVHRYLSNETIFLQSGSFLAASPSLTIESKWQGMTKGFFSGESFFLIKCSGTGDLWFNSFGAVERIDTDGHLDLAIDTGHIVAFTEGLTYNIQKVGGYKSFFFSGEGFACRFSGKGTVWIQTRKPNRFLSWLYYFRPVRRNN